MTSIFAFRKNFDLKQIAEQKIERTHRELEKELEGAIREIVRRTQSGQDMDNRQFADYTDEYKAWKQGFTKSGKLRSRGGRAKRAEFRKVGTVNLTYSGDMLAAINSKVERVGNDLLGILFFNNPNDAAKARGNMEKRKFFGLSKEQIERLIQKMRNALNERN